MNYAVIEILTGNGNDFVRYTVNDALLEQAPMVTKLSSINHVHTKLDKRQFVYSYCMSSSNEINSRRRTSLKERNRSSAHHETKYGSYFSKSEIPFT